MSLHQARLVLRYIRSNISMTLINLVGLTIAMTAVIPIVLYVRHELSFDKGFDKASKGESKPHRKGPKKPAN